MTALRVCEIVCMVAVGASASPTVGPDPDLVPIIEEIVQRSTDSSADACGLFSRLRDLVPVAAVESRPQILATMDFIQVRLEV